MKTTLLALVVLVGCTQQQKTISLAEISSGYDKTSLDIVARGDIAVALEIAPTSDCPMLQEDATAFFDGVPMHVQRGGYATTADGCFPISFSADPFPMDTVMGFERQTNSSQFEVIDSSAHWMVTAGRLFGNDFVNDPANSRVVWEDVTAVTSARVAPAAPVQIQGNAILYPPGATISWVDAYAVPHPTRCDGPATCTVFVEGSRDWTINP
jgi:hypothetical protein